ncbi:hypothetical protein ERJ75_000418500 [Trypanosoma vivax]|nr:hypothetical protein ERJ75_000418500 [Trypanosoma vivax]
MMTVRGNVDTLDESALRAEITRLEKLNKERLLECGKLLKELCNSDNSVANHRVFLGHSSALEGKVDGPICLTLCDPLLKLQTVWTHVMQAERLVALSCAGALNLAELLPSKSLRVLELSGLSVSCAESLGSLESLEEVSLRCMNVSAEVLRGVAALPNLARFVLDEVENVVDASVISEMRMLSELEILNCPRLHGNIDFSQLMFLRKLEVAGTGTAACDDLVQQVAQCEFMQELHLLDCGAITDITPVLGMRALEVLCLSNIPKVELREGNDHRLPPLRVLRLTDSGVTDEAVAVLLRAGSLEEVSFLGCPITTVSPPVPLERLKVLDLSWCTRMRSLGAASHMPALERLLLRATPVADEYVGAVLSDALSELDLRCWGTLSENTVARVTSIGTLRVLRLDSLGSAALHQLCLLQVLEVCGASITNDVIGAVAELCVELKCLSLIQCRGVTNVGALASLKALWKLHLSGLGGGEGIVGVVALRQLIELTLDGSFVTNDVILHVSESKALSTLCVRRAKHLSDVSHLSEVSTLDSVTFCDCDGILIGLMTRAGDGPSPLCTASRITFSHMNVPDKVLKLLGAGPNIMHINLEWCGTVNASTLAAAGRVQFRIRDCAALHVTGKDTPLNTVVQRTPIVTVDGCAEA